jgi:hypothetical protein
MHTDISDSLTILKQELQHYIHQNYDSPTGHELQDLCSFLWDINTILLRIGTQSRFSTLITNASRYQQACKEIEEAVNTIRQSTTSIVAVHEMLHSLRHSINSLIQHVEPPEPWPRR